MPGSAAGTGAATARSGARAAAAGAGIAAATSGWRAAAGSGTGLGAASARGSTAVAALADYFDLVPAEHNQRPNFMATVGLSVQPYVDGINIANALIGLFDLDTAVGQQLDFTGQWIGVGRNITVDAAVWFSFDIAGLGFDQGRWITPFETSTRTVALADDAGDPISYRTLLKARVVANRWDGTIPGAYEAWNTLFAGTGYQVLIQDGGPRAVHYFSFDTAGSGFDQAQWWQLPLPVEPRVNGNMNLIEALLGPAPSPTTLALFTGGYLELKSAGVGITYMIQSATETAVPLFGFDAGPSPGYLSLDVSGLGLDQAPFYGTSTGAPNVTYPPYTIAGFDAGAWGQIVNPVGG
jgi:hypothetical protein